MPVRFADHLDVYHLVYNLLEKRPVNCPRDNGNLEIVLPDRRQGDVPGGKSPERFNYLGQRSQGIINKKLKLMMRELIDFQILRIFPSKIRQNSVIFPSILPPKKDN